jgi:hypothetical protein
VKIKQCLSNCIRYLGDLLVILHVHRSVGPNDAHHWRRASEQHVQTGRAARRPLK